MRKLILAAALVIGGTFAAEADTLATLNASQIATGKLDSCFDSNFQPGRDKPGSDASKNRLLRACAAEWDEAAEACHVNTGNPIKDCRKQTGSLAEDYLNLKGAGLH